MSLLNDFLCYFQSVSREREEFLSLVQKEVNVDSCKHFLKTANVLWNLKLWNAEYNYPFYI